MTRTPNFGINNLPRPRAVILTAVSTKLQVDKVSLEEQERMCREFAAANEMVVVDVLSIRGHSRAEPDVFTLFESYGAIGENAYQRLRQHWQTNDFDVLLAFHVNRLGRSFSIQALVLENVIRLGRRAYFIQGGWVDDASVDVFIASSGIASKSETRYRVRMSGAGTQKRIELGLHPRRVGMTHRVLYDDRGNQIGLALRDENIPMLNAAADLIIEGVGWHRLSFKLADKGFIHPQTGKPYSASMLWRIFYSPFSWGHAATNFTTREGIWAFDPTEPPPPGVHLIWQTRIPIPPVWTGQRAVALQAELLRRPEMNVGRAAAKTEYHLTGLMRCAVCGRRMAVSWSIRKSGRRVVYWVCPAVKSKTITPCTNRTMIRDDYAKSEISAFLRRYGQYKREDLMGLLSAPPSAKAQIEQFQAQIAGMESQLGTLIDEQSRAPEMVRRIYAQKISNLAEALKSLQEELRDQQRRTPIPEVVASRIDAFESLMRIIDQLWELEPIQVNRLVHHFLGKARFTIDAGKVISIS